MPKKLTPVLIVDTIEPCLPFWVDRLGFEATAQVPHGDRLGFVILSRGSAEVMLQSCASVAADLPGLAPGPHRTTLFVEVEDLAAVQRALEGLPPLFAERVTPYGAREVGARDPAGNAVIFAAFGG